MKTIRAIFVLALLGILAPCCDNPFDKNVDHSHDPWLQHKVAAWHVTPGGHVRDAGPFASVDGAWIKDTDIDQATDAAYARYAALFPEYPVSDHPFSINDDYVMWASPYKNGADGVWAAGDEFVGGGQIGVTMFTRMESATDPSPQFIVRPPGFDQWGTYHVNYRYTTGPLVPALEHELLHAAIGDAQHRSQLWQRLSQNPRT